MAGMSLRDQLKQRAVEEGFDLFGVAPAVPGKDLEFIREWLERGFAGEMRYLSNPKRLDPKSVLPSVQSVICVGLIYNTPWPSSMQVGPRASISRYAWGSDYHEIMREKLERLRAAMEMLAPGAETRVFVDTGPVSERAFARWSGLGWMGKNTMIINEAKGSWFFLGVILTNIALEPGLPAPDRCGSCTACLDACPTGALVEPYVMDARRCISYLTIEFKGSIPEDLRPRMGNHIFGCDICQDVGPWNGRSQESDVRSQEKSFEPMVVSCQPSGVGSWQSPVGSEEQGNLQLPSPTTFSLFNPSLEDLAFMTEEQFRETFRHSPIKRTKYRGWLRNLCVAMGNSGDACFIPRLTELASHADPVIREHAAWAIERIQNSRES